MKRGFTLLEVLISLMIFALAAVVLGGAYINVLIGYEVVGRGHGDDQDVGYARQELMMIPDLQTAEAGDKFDTVDGRNIQWTAAIEPTSTADLFTVTLTCALTATANSETRTVTQTFMLLRPTWSEPADRSKLRQDAATRIAQVQGKQQQ